MEISSKLKLNKSLSRVCRFTLSAAGLALSTVALPVIPAVGVPLLYKSAKEFNAALKGHYIKNSMINVGDKNIITQELPEIRDVATLMFLNDTKDKQRFLCVQELNFLLGAKLDDDKGNRIKYNTRSQALTYMMLSRLQKSGYVQNLEKKPAKDSRLIAEKAMLGNFKGFGKKNKMYYITFEKTDKELTKKEISQMFEMNQEELEKSFKFKQGKDGKIQSVKYSLPKLIRQKIIKGLGKNDKKLLPKAKDDISIDDNIKRSDIIAELKEHVKSNEDIRFNDVEETKKDKEQLNLEDRFTKS